MSNATPSLQVFEYPVQIIFDYMHMVCLNHLQSIVKRWCQTMKKEHLYYIDDKLKQIQLPHNLRVTFLDSVSSIEQWKAKNGRTFLLFVGVPLAILYFPNEFASHFSIYATAMTMLHSPISNEEIDLAEQLIHYYCKTARTIHGPSIELFSLHAHLHLPEQVRQHGGLAGTSAFAFESCIHFIKKKAHGSKSLATQIAYWIEMQVTSTTDSIKLPITAFFNVIFNSF
jgi:hypothetical protein